MGHIDEGGRLPTEAELCKQYSVSRHTVRQAFQDLVAEGLVHRVPGRGSFVTGLSRRGKYLRSIGSLEEVMSWPGTEMELVEPALYVERTYYDGDGTPVETALSYYNPRRYSYRLELRRRMGG